MIKWLSRLWTKTKGPLDNVSPRVQKLFVLTRKEADRLHQSYVGTEHLLLGLLELQEGVGFQALKRMNVDLGELRRELDNRVSLGPETVIAPSIPYTPLVKKTLRLGAIEARALGHEYLGTEHVLLGMLRSRWGIAGEVLRSRGVELKKTREAVSDILKAATNEKPKPS